MVEICNEGHFAGMFWIQMSPYKNSNLLIFILLANICIMMETISSKVPRTALRAGREGISYWMVWIWYNVKCYGVHSRQTFTQKWQWWEIMANMLDSPLHVLSQTTKSGDGKINHSRNMKLFGLHVLAQHIISNL